MAGFRSSAMGFGITFPSGHAVSVKVDPTQPEEAEAAVLLANTGPRPVMVPYGDDMVIPRLTPEEVTNLLAEVSRWPQWGMSRYDASQCLRRLFP